MPWRPGGRGGQVARTAPFERVWCEVVLGKHGGNVLGRAVVVYYGGRGEIVVVGRREEEEMCKSGGGQWCESGRGRERRVEVLGRDGDIGGGL